jgi:cytochrome P450
MKLLMYSLFSLQYRIGANGGDWWGNQMSASIDFDVFNPNFRQNPYPFYQRLREADPVHWNPPGAWLVTRYVDAVAVLRDSNIGHATGRTAEYTDYLLQQGKLSPIELLLSHWMVSKNPPDHARLRNLVNRAFTPAAIEALRPQIQQIVDGLLDKVEKQGTFDLIADLAYPLPVTVIAALLGVPLDEHERFRQWSRDLLGVIDIVQSPEAVKRGNAAIQKFIDYFRELIAERRKNPQADLLSALIAVQEQDDRLNETELIANCILLFVAGHETTMNLIGNGMLALLSCPDQLLKLRDDSSLITRAIEELLRYESPVQFYGRAIREDTVLNGKQLRKGQALFILPGAINRDPAQFPNPDRLDITRQENHHLAFGYGIHFCLGAPLARVEGQIAIATLVRRMPQLKLQTETVTWQDTLAVRGLKSLPVST